MSVLAFENPKVIAVTRRSITFQVVWFCSMRKRPDVHIQTAINKRLMTAKFLKLHPSGLKLRVTFNEEAMSVGIM
ncbi:hypothetical protein JHK84_035537 [Glycine max]|uniref:Uncharacterized protein n=1 Tax=Glycine soja TaxID=3848 RepID=A0A0B2P7H9_GLYSO|nr:hypothetical protein JHK84_035537 [Glycine max]KHN05166.1 hypothetical protein glysoja_028064 [Glycine soja]